MPAFKINLSGSLLVPLPHLSQGGGEHPPTTARLMGNRHRPILNVPYTVLDSGQALNLPKPVQAHISPSNTLHLLFDLTGYELRVRGVTASPLTTATATPAPVYGTTPNDDLGFVVDLKWLDPGAALRPAPNTSTMPPGTAAQFLIDHGRLSALAPTIGPRYALNGRPAQPVSPGFRLEVPFTNRPWLELWRPGGTAAAIRLDISASAATGDVPLSVYSLCDFTGHLANDPLDVLDYLPTVHPFSVTANPTRTGGAQSPGGGNCPGARIS